MKQNKNHLNMTSEVRHADYPFNWLIYAYKYSPKYSVRNQINREDVYNKLINSFNERDYNELCDSFDNILDFISYTGKVSNNTVRDIQIFINVFKQKMTYIEIGELYDLGSAHIPSIINNVTQYLQTVKIIKMMLTPNITPLNRATISSINQSDIDTYGLEPVLYSKLSTRAYNCLIRGVSNVRYCRVFGESDIKIISEKSILDIVKIRGVGPDTLKELLTTFKKYGIKLKPVNSYEMDMLMNLHIYSKYKDIIKAYLDM